VSPRPRSSTCTLNRTGTCCHGRHPAQRGIARLTVSKSRKGERREAVVVMLGDMVRVTVETLALFGELLA